MEALLTVTHCCHPKVRISPGCCSDAAVALGHFTADPSMHPYVSWGAFVLRFPSGEDCSAATDAHKALFSLLSFRQVPRVPVALSCSLGESFSRNLAVPTVLAAGCCPRRRSTLQKSLQSPGGCTHLASPLQHRHLVPEPLPSPAAERCFGDTSPLSWFFPFFIFFFSPSLW